MAMHEADALAKVQAELASLEAESAELADQYLRAKADVENARRRAEDEISKARKFALESFAESLLPGGRQPGSRSGHQRCVGRSDRRGAQATLRQLIAALERNKVIAIAPTPGTEVRAPACTRPSA